MVIVDKLHCGQVIVDKIHCGQISYYVGHCGQFTFMLVIVDKINLNRPKWA